MDELGIGGHPRGFVIDGRPLRELVELGGNIYVPDYTRALLLREPSPLSSGRVPLYVCSQCADLGCGAIAVRVTAIDDSIVWSDFAIDSFAGESPVTWLDERWERDFYFSRAQYEATIY